MLRKRLRKREEVCVVLCVCVCVCVCVFRERLRDQNVCCVFCVCGIGFSWHQRNALYKCKDCKSPLSFFVEDFMAGNWLRN